MYYIDLAVTGISFGCMYAMMSVGLTLVYGLLRILHVAHAAVFALGAYVTVLVANATGSIALGFLASLPFPGNVRQLENLCNWLTVMAPAQTIEQKDLPPQ